MALLNVAWRPIVPLREIGIAAFFGENLWGKNVLVLHYWSLSIEEQFYLVWPAILFFCPRKHLLHVVLAWIALAPLWFHLNLKLLGATEVNVSRRTFARIDCSPALPSPSRSVTRSAPASGVGARPRDVGVSGRARRR